MVNKFDPTVMLEKQYGSSVKFRDNRPDTGQDDRIEKFYGEDFVGSVAPTGVFTFSLSLVASDEVIAHSGTRGVGGIGEGAIGSGGIGGTSAPVESFSAVIS